MATPNTFDCFFDRRYGPVIGQPFGCGQNKIEHGQLAIYFYSFSEVLFLLLTDLFATFVSNCKLESLCANGRRNIVNYIHRLATQEDARFAFRKGHF